MNKRPRINTNALCSSANYKASRRAHVNMLRIYHETNESKCKELLDTADIDTYKQGLCIFEANIKRIFTKRKASKEIKVSPWND